jgi:hypothetical protein
VETGSREENASKQNHGASLLILSEAERRWRFRAKHDGKALTETAAAHLRSLRLFSFSPAVPALAGRPVLALFRSRTDVPP